ncbi:MAG: macro domain-containing protein [Pseudonocardiaceae bacterium]
MARDGQRKCFVIMPFGEQTGADGKLINFDDVYQELFLEPVGSLGFDVIRCDEIATAGSIHKDMFTHIAMDDLALVDITTANPNVFYELGVRHALKPSITVLTKHRGTKVPFNIQGQRVIEYPSETGSWAASRAEIRDFIANGLRENEPDSPIFTILQDARKDWKRERIDSLKEHPYRLRKHPQRRIHVITGDIREWPGIDVWVNSENTNMQMARFYDRSLSAMIRYEGAAKDDNGEVIDDTIARELAAVLGGRESVTPGTVYVTSAGSLAATRGVKKIFHAATTQGIPGSGYQVMRDVEKCVTTALWRMDHERYRDDKLRSIFFPMMGTGEGGGAVNVVAGRLIRAAVSYFMSNPASNVTTVFFSGWNWRDLDACLAALDGLDDVEPMLP